MRWASTFPARRASSAARRAALVRTCWSTIHILRVTAMMKLALTCQAVQSAICSERQARGSVRAGTEDSLPSFRFRNCAGTRAVPNAAPAGKWNPCSIGRTARIHIESPSGKRVRANPDLRISTIDKNRTDPDSTGVGVLHVKRRHFQRSRWRAAVAGRRQARNRPRAINGLANRNRALKSCQTASAGSALRFSPMHVDVNSSQGIYQKKKVAGKTLAAEFCVGLVNGVAESVRSRTKAAIHENVIPFRFMRWISARSESTHRQATIFFPSSSCGSVIAARIGDDTAGIPRVSPALFPKS